MFSRHLRSSTAANGTRLVTTRATVIRYHENNETSSEEGRSYVTESRIVRWRRESVNGNANLIIAGSMLGIVLTVVLLVFYLSHRSMRKRNDECPQRRWMESDASLEVYTVDQFFDAPPPSRANDDRQSASQPNNNHPILPPPSYELAVANSTEFANPNRLLQLFSARPKCRCQQKPQLNHLLPTHQQYDLVKRCRQCRRFIRGCSDSDTEQSGSEFCECLLQNTVEGDFPVEENQHTDIPANNLASQTFDHRQSMDEEEVLDRYESADALDESGLPSYRTAAKLSLMVCEK